MNTVHRCFQLVFMLILLSMSYARADIGLKTSWFVEGYNETINLQYDGGNTVGSSHLIEGIKYQFPAFINTMDLYLKQRYGSDANRDYWNNRGEFMLGMRMRFFKKIYVALFYEYIRGWYVGDANSQNPNPYGNSYEDMRYGLIFWQGMDLEYKDKWTDYFPITFWDEIYADAIFYKRNENNFISYTNIMAGTRWVRIHKSVFDTYVALYYGFDTNKDFWNNKIDYGLGFRLKPWTDLELSLFLEFLNGQYLERNGRYPIPDDLNYKNRRYGVLFWFGLGN